MDRERMQKSETEQAKDVPFSSSMTEDNMPTNDPYANNGASDDRTGYGPERRVGKNTGPDTPVDPHYALPPDPHAPPGDMNPGSSAEVSDFGISDKVCASSGSIHQYGLDK